MKINDTDARFTSTLITACFDLHNLCEVHNSFDDNWLTNENADDHTSAPSTATSIEAHVTTAVAIRNELCDY